MKLATRLSIVLGPALAVLLGGLVYGALEQAQDVLLEQLNLQAIQTAKARAQELEAGLALAASASEGLAAAAEASSHRDSASFRRKLEAALRRNPDVYGSCLASVPGAEELGGRAPYLFRRDGKLQEVDLGEVNYDYPQQPWFRRAVEEQRGGWTEPYFDQGGGEARMITYSTPVFVDGRVVAVATVDLSLQGLIGRVRELSAGLEGYAFLVSPAGSVVGHPRTGQGDSGEELRLGQARAPTEELARVVDPFTREPMWQTSVPLAEAGWRLVLMRSEREMLRPLDELQVRYLLVALTVLALLLGILYLGIKRAVADPLARLARQTGDYASGAYGSPLPEERGPAELRGLSKDFNRMGRAIVAQMETIRREAEGRERVEHELRLAAELQRGILPRVFPPFPGLSESLDLYGVARPAREVGGDFFDFIPLGDGRIGVLIADVSGKGVPAALFMTMARMAVRLQAGQDLPPSEILRRANRILAQDNPSCMFVTLLLAELDLMTGRLRVATAGHPAPLLVSPGEPPRALELPASLPLGAMEGARYEDRECTVPIGGSLVLYTDGATEAFSLDGEEFGAQRLLQAVAAGRELDARGMAESVASRVASFEAGAAASDDLTLVTVRRIAARPAEPLARAAATARIELPARRDALALLAQVANAVARSAGLAEEARGRLELALDEVATNVVLHGYGEEASRTFAVRFRALEGSVVAEVIDSGKAFDFHAAASRYTGEASAEQPIGGLGLYLARQSAEELTYAPQGPEGNTTRIVVRNRVLPG